MTEVGRPGRTWKHHDPMGGVALLTLLDTGRRHQEVLRMEWRHMDLEAGTTDLGSTKGKTAGDIVYLSEAPAAAGALYDRPGTGTRPWPASRTSPRTSRASTSTT